MYGRAQSVVDPLHFARVCRHQGKTGREEKVGLNTNQRCELMAELLKRLREQTHNYIPIAKYDPEFDKE